MNIQQYDMGRRRDRREKEGEGGRRQTQADAETDMRGDGTRLEPINRVPPSLPLWPTPICRHLSQPEACTPQKIKKQIAE